MKIQYLSDLHFEFGSIYLLDIINKCQSDVIVVAGDLHSSKGIVQSLRDIYVSVNKPVIFTAGNHEYYHSTKQYVDEQLLEEFNQSNIHVLNNSTWEYNGIMFLGSTGWWTRNEAKSVVDQMNDFSYIFDLQAANYGLAWGWEAREFFNYNLNKYDKRRRSGKTVVCVSHNAPSLKSIGDRFQGDELNPCFVNAWEHLMLSYKPAVWIHGHVHDTKDYIFDDTHVVCNPYGYKGIRNAMNESFDPCKIIEI